MSYTQSNEEPVILNHFQGKTDGRLLEIGAYHPKAFSNSRALIELGWSAVLIEPSPKCIVTLMESYKDNPKITLVNAAVASNARLILFHDSAGATATMNQQQFDTWKVQCKDYQSIYMPTLPASAMSVFGKFDFISIDCEGADYEILQSLPAEFFDASMLMIEYSHNGQEIMDFMLGKKYRLTHQNGENLIFVK